MQLHAKDAESQHASLWAGNEQAVYYVRCSVMYAC